MSSSVDLPLFPVDNAQMDIHADQRGRIIGSCVAIFVITDVFILLRLVSRKLARAGYWVRIRTLMIINYEVLTALSSGMIFSLLLQW